MGALAMSSGWTKCRLCGGELTPTDNRAVGLHASCATRPEARRLGPAVPPVDGRRPAARGFTVADRSLIRSVSGYMPLRDLLRVLNERLVADLGPDAAPYTMEQLHAEVGQRTEPTHVDSWGGLRRLIAEARRSGVLAQVNLQVVDDFAVVFQLTAAQVTTLKDVIRHAKEGA